MPDFSSGREALRALQIAANWMIKDVIKDTQYSRDCYLRARFQFGTRGAESTTNRRELDDQRWQKVPVSDFEGQPQIMFCFKLI